MFVSFYLATFWIGLSIGIPFFQWIAVISAVCATTATITLWHHGRWDLGLRVAPRVATIELLAGFFFAVALIGTADVLIIAFTPLHHVHGRGFPIAEALTVFLPAALHEELVFRGYPYQLLRRWKRWFAIASSSLVFAAIHAGNSDVTALALVNIFLGGIVLALAYERRRRLWMPIGLHFAWNMMSGPILGYEVSGFAARESLLTTVVVGPPLATGGGFGIEGSIVMTGLELGGILLLWRMNAEFRMQNSE
ncbi:MAG TPA: CPBP family intramembrane glutamic endopeptidase [Thermoanaerobaculia bacterium]|nr:CPBP family intramembrane glutamic endopeptidase [Thermoanaerobaculia bacterium]